jgi:hypothetical protein
MTRDEAIDGAAPIFARSRWRRDVMSPQKAAEAAWYVGHPLGSIDAIRDLIVAQRKLAEQPQHLPLAA